VGCGKLNASTLGLPPLSREQTAVLISESLERSLLPAEIQQALLERAEGNPLFAEQFAQLYRERGSADDLPLPETLQGIIAARLDGLAADAKALLQDAAVIEKVFWTGALRRDERDATPPLHALERKGFLTRQRRSSVQSKGEWAFAHMLLRDVAYGQIPRGDLARAANDPQEIMPNLAAAAAAFETQGHVEEARALAGELVGAAAPTRRRRSLQFIRIPLHARCARTRAGAPRDPEQRSLPQVESRSPSPASTATSSVRPRCGRRAAARPGKRGFAFRPPRTSSRRADAPG
jgi:hypothetical protein